VGRSLAADGKELQPLVSQLSASLSKRLAANSAILESGLVPTDLIALLTVIDELSASGLSVIGTMDDDSLTSEACMRAATLALSVRLPRAQCCE
jgi:hypothetical protein